MSRRNRQSSVQLASPLAASSSARSRPSGPSSPNADLSVPPAEAAAHSSIDPADLTISFIPQPSLNSSHPPLSFAKITRTLSSPDTVLRIGRYSDPPRPARDDQNASPGGEVASANNGGAGVGSGPEDVASGAISSGSGGSTSHRPDSPIGFKSKVVSRRHCEIWYQGSEWYIKDVKSSSGTFVNHFRLSGPKSESLPHRIRNGDIIQLGIDFRGGQEEIFRCVKMTVLIGKNAQPRVTTFK